MRIYSVDLIRKAFTRTTGTALLTGLFLILSPLTNAAETPFTWWPEADYDPAVPTLEQVVGHETGTKISWHAQIVAYFRALEAYAPDRVKLFSYGKTWEGRELIYAAITSPTNMARLDDIRAGMKALADPRVTDAARARTLTGDLPAIVWLAYSVHGNEISSSDAAMQTAYHLLAARGDDRVAGMLDNTVVIINPLQNPDGRDRFIHRFETALGLEPDSDSLSAEHNEPWPNGRTNHYLFDMNRDWIILTQPETRGHVAALQDWYPQVFVDLHEMGGNSTYYFAPEAVPYNPHLAQNQRDSLFLFGRTNAKWFDRFGFDYFTRDIFDAFYPGYGASWPAYYGAISMTYEQASSRGLLFRRNDGSEFDYRSTVRQHFVASLATIETTATNRQKLLDDFYDFQVTAIEEGRNDRTQRTYLFPGTRDRAGTRKLMGILAEQGIEISRADAEFRACGQSYPAGTHVIDTAQPRKRMIRTLLDRQIDMEADFVRIQEARRARDLPHDIYDVTGWSLPVMFNVDMDTCGRPVTTGLIPVGMDRIATGTLSNPEASVAFLSPWGDMAAGRLLAAALRAELTVKTHDEGFTHQGRVWPAGTLIFDVADNAADLGATLTALAAETGAEIVGVSSSWVDSGKDFGSRAVRTIPRIRVAMAWDDPTSSYAAGNTRFVLERQIGYPVTAIRTDALKTADLTRYHVLILPGEGFGGSYMDTLGETGAATLKDWVRRGGVLVGTHTALRYLTHEKIKLLSTARENQPRGDEAAGTSGDEKSRVAATIIDNKDDMKALLTPAAELPDSLPGVLVHANVDGDHWLGAGVAPTLSVLARGRDIYAPVAMDKARTVAWFAGADDLLASGYIWQENREQMTYKPFALVEPAGRGYVIGFTQDPTVRAYLDGLNVILANAVFRGAAHARPVR